MDTHSTSVPVIAIDGPAGSGKSSVAKRVAVRLGLPHIDTGAMYRALTLKALQSNINLNDGKALAELLRATKIHFGPNQITFLDGMDVSSDIRGTEVSSYVSRVAAHSEVRECLVSLQREIGKHGGVMEGRDIGTVVFPDAKLKVFLYASLEVRAQRRQKDLRDLHIYKSLEEVMKELDARDRFDSEREASPLRCAPDAKELDTTNLTIDEVVQQIVQWAKEVGFQV
ncbi:MAG: (d)CMP kinase [bacterium]|nr:(d)CMP kinase [bacterium]